MVNERAQRIRQRVSIPVDAEPAPVCEVVSDLSRWKSTRDIGTSLVDKDSPGAVPIPSTPIPMGEVRELSEAELKALRARPLHEVARDALECLGGRDYFIRVAQHDHKAFLTFLSKVVPKDINLGAADSLKDLVLASQRYKTLKDAEVLIVG